MNKQRLATVAVTVIAASALLAVLLLAVQNASDTRSIAGELSCLLPETLTYKINSCTLAKLSTLQLMLDGLSEVGTWQQSHQASSSLGLVLGYSTEKKVSNQVTPEYAVQTDDDQMENISPTALERVAQNEASVPMVVNEKPENIIPSVVFSNSYLSELAEEIHRLTNIERTRAGKSILASDTQLAAIAKQHSQDMAENNHFSHSNADGCDQTCRLEAAGYEASAWGENIAWRSSSQPPEAAALAANFVDWWMNSEGHRRNILSDDFTQEGVGVAAVGNKVYATVNFADPW